jgi:type III secretion protein J
MLLQLFASIRKRLHSFSVISALIGVCLFLTGCGSSELYTRLEERDANIMIAILLEKGIPAEKTPGEENTFTVNVPLGRFGEAVDILRDHGYPRTNFQGVGVAFQKGGLVSSPTEERIRYMYALSQDIAHTVTLIDGVIDARVHLVLPENNPFNETFFPASAAVFVDYRSDSSVPSYTNQIKNLVVNSIEGLDPNKVSIAMFPVDLKTSISQLAQSKGTTSVLFIDVAPSSTIPFVLLVFFLLLIAGAGAFGAFFFYWVGFMGRELFGIKRMEQVGTTAKATTTET